MTLQAPVTQTTFDRRGARAGRHGHDLLAPVAALVAAARDARAPLLRRLRLIAAAGRRADALFALRADELRARGSGERGAAARARLRSLLGDAHAVFGEELVPALRARGVALCAPAELPGDERRALARLFRAEVAPLLTPLTVDAAHPFPCVASGAPCLAVLVQSPRGAGARYVGIEVPPVIPRFVSLAPGGALLAVEDLIGAELASLLPGLDVVCRHAFRVTRDGRPLRARERNGGAGRRTGAAVRLEVAAAAPHDLRVLLARGLGLDPESDVDASPGPLDLAGAAGLLVARCHAGRGALEIP